MDRDRNENVIDPEEEKTPSTGQTDYGETGEQRRREAGKHGDDADRGSIPPQPDKVPLNPD
jgi:hypothetical protein